MLWNLYREIWKCTGSRVLGYSKCMKLMRGGRGMEAWVKLDDGDMTISQSNQELLFFAPMSSSASHDLVNADL